MMHLVNIRFKSICSESSLMHERILTLGFGPLGLGQKCDKMSTLSMCWVTFHESKLFWDNAESAFMMEENQDRH